MQCGGVIKSVFDLGALALSGIFPNQEALSSIKVDNLNLGICNQCDLVQLTDYVEPNSYFTKNYGYESSLNLSMKLHLQKKMENLVNVYCDTQHLPQRKPIIVDIASNDGTMLSVLDSKFYLKVGIDPLIENFREKYSKDTVQINHFFSKEIFFNYVKYRASVVTSCAVLYDLNNPRKFVEDVYEILDENGIWHFEQSYLYSMMESISYDTICHEHFLYLSLKDIYTLLSENNFWIEDVELNGINGGSIAVTARKNSYAQQSLESLPAKAREILATEASKNVINELNSFKEKSILHSRELKKLLTNLRISGKKIFGIGASTKGNVLLQFSGLDNNFISAIGEINKTKIGKFTPGTGIPIVDESSILVDPQNSVLLVLPWHFRKTFLELTKDFRNRGGKLIFPLPRIEIF